MSLSNYPDNMNWAAYDDEYDPVLECGHRSSSECECWCDGGEYETSHLIDTCTVDNCIHLQCQSCFAPTDKVEHTVNNLQRQNSQGEPMWVALNKPLRFIPQNELLKARLCDGCKVEYDDEIKNKELIQ
tara:strand:+ start:594 stop:980 length:387 start_codon:yes stop_codon:yes gene_type:complete